MFRELYVHRSSKMGVHAQGPKNIQVSSLVSLQPEEEMEGNRKSLWSLSLLRASWFSLLCLMSTSLSPTNLSSTCQAVLYSIQFFPFYFQLTFVFHKCLIYSYYKNLQCYKVNLPLKLSPHLYSQHSSPRTTTLKHFLKTHTRDHCCKVVSLLQNTLRTTPLRGTRLGLFKTQCSYISGYELPDILILNQKHWLVWPPIKEKYINHYNAVNKIKVIGQMIGQTTQFLQQKHLQMKKERETEVGKPNRLKETY